MYYTKESDLPTLEGYINKNQSFRIITSNPRILYAYGEFYKPQMKFGREYDHENSIFEKIIKSKKELYIIGNEKGLKCNEDEDTWDNNSLFYLLHKVWVSGRNREANPFLIVCDDLGTEIADFIYVENERVIFIHG
ncbi:MAG: hypothetical protein MZV64_02845 [Ignavibacteriales bacterium]|nr:hypothetical protein [Ignavibacteriales bacterium]